MKLNHRRSGLHILDEEWKYRILWNNFSARWDRCHMKVLCSQSCGFFYSSQNRHRSLAASMVSSSDDVNIVSYSVDLKFTLVNWLFFHTQQTSCSNVFPSFALMEKLEVGAIFLAPCYGIEDVKDLRLFWRQTNKQTGAPINTPHFFPENQIWSVPLPWVMDDPENAEKCTSLGF